MSSTNEMPPRQPRTDQLPPRQPRTDQLPPRQHAQRKTQSSPIPAERPARLFDVMDEYRPSDRPHLSIWDGAGFEHLTWDDWRYQAERATAGARALRADQLACLLYRRAGGMARRRLRRFTAYPRAWHGLRYLPWAAALHI
jgi:hypothetical protein